MRSDDVVIWVDGEDLSPFFRSADLSPGTDLEPGTEGLSSLGRVFSGEVSGKLEPRLPFEVGDVLRLQSGDLHRDMRVVAIDREDLSFCLESCDGAPLVRLDIPGTVIALTPPDGIRRELEIVEPDA